MRVVIYPDLASPKRLDEKLSHLSLLKELMEKMKVGEVAKIKKENWKIKTKPARAYGAYVNQKREKYRFSGREDKENYYIKKVQGLISEEGKSIRRVWQ